MKTEIKDSPPLHIMQLVWNGKNPESWLRLNNSIDDILVSLIQLGFSFEESDYEQIDKRFRGAYWFGASSNGHHSGERHYRTACKIRNISVCQSFEKYTGRVPFLIDSVRLYEGFEFSYQGLYWRVTGWAKDNQAINAVGYTNCRSEGKKALIQFNRDQWLQVRKGIKAI